MDVAQIQIHDMEEEPRTSMRMSAAMEKVSQNTVVRMVYEKLLLPYHFQEVQSLNPSDYSRRTVFSYWPLQKRAINAHLISDNLFTNETGFI
jgi:hypothetical protein